MAHEAIEADVDTTNELTAELHNVLSGEDTLTAHISVLDDGSWIGDFFAVFEQRANEDVYAADWSSVKNGNGLYAEEGAPFWPVEAVVETLESRCNERTFQALNGGPGEK